MSFFSKVVSLGLLFFLSLIAFKTLAVSNVAKSKIETSYEETFENLRIHGILERILKNLDQHNFFILPRIHFGELTYADGSLNLPSKNLELLPHPEANAISYFKLHVPSTQKVIQENPLTTCSIFSLEFPARHFKSYLAISENGYSHMVGTQEHIQDSNCRVFSLQPSKNMIVANNNLTTPPEVIIPITSEYTIYLDRKNTLRFLGHAGQVNIENQPLLDHVSEFKIKSELHDNRIYEIRYLDHFLYSHIARQTIDIFLKAIL